MSPLDPDAVSYLRTAFLDRVAHELRGPLGVIEGAMHEIEHSLDEGGASQQPMLDMARRSVRRIARIADRLQQTALCERAQLELLRQRSDLADVLRRSVDDAATIEGRRTVRVELETPAGPIPCEIDERWMAIALYELASNAIRHARSTVKVRLEVDDEGCAVCFVDDNQRPSHFEPLRFRQPIEKRGLGLALAIVRDVVQAHGGQLAIQPASDDLRGDAPSGTSVSVRIPRAQKPQTIEATP